MGMGVYRVDTILQRGAGTHPKWKVLPVPTDFSTSATPCDTCPTNRLKYYPLSSVQIALQAALALAAYEMSFFA